MWLKCKANTISLAFQKVVAGSVESPVKGDDADGDEAGSASDGAMSDADSDLAPIEWAQPPRVRSKKHKATDPAEVPEPVFKKESYNEIIFSPSRIHQGVRTTPSPARQATPPA